MAGNKKRLLGRPPTALKITKGAQLTVSPWYQAVSVLRVTYPVMDGMCCWPMGRLWKKEIAPKTSRSLMLCRHLGSVCRLFRCEKKIEKFLIF
jgi:hypothetical protein